jgi:DNA-binding NarL/FixJ family response regulator
MNPRQKMPIKRHSSVLDILIAHDNEILRIGLRTLLKDYGAFRICGETDTTAETLKKVEKLQPSMLLLKLDLPDKGALEIIPELLRLRPGLRVLLIATDGPVMDGRQAVLTPKVAKRALDGGVMGLVLKPDAHDIRLALEALSANKPFVSFNMFAGMTNGVAQRTDLPLADLTGREMEVFKRIATGRSTKEIAADLHISPRTAEVYRANILHKLGFHSHAQLILFASQNNLV